jgi:hypothetical protein
VNSHTSAFDLAVFGFEPQPLEASRMAAMPIGISPNGDNVLLSIPTVLGGNYSIESKGKLDQTLFKLEGTFQGDGTVQTRSIPVTGSETYFRVNGY